MGQAIPRRHPAVVLRSHNRQLKALLAILLVAIVGLGVTVAILATDDEGSIEQAAQTAQPTLQTARPDESAVAAAISPKPTVVRPDESAVAAAIATQPEVARPDESKVAAAISRTQQIQADNVHDESDVAAAIAGR